MLRYIVRRVLWGILMLAIVSAVVFVIFYVFPSADPATLRAGRNASPQQVDAIRHSLGLDQPVYVAVLRLHEGHRPALRLRLQLSVERRRPDA